MDESTRRITPVAMRGAPVVPVEQDKDKKDKDKEKDTEVVEYDSDGEVEMTKSEEDELDKSRAVTIGYLRRVFLFLMRICQCGRFRRIEQ